MKKVTLAALVLAASLPFGMMAQAQQSVLMDTAKSVASQAATDAKDAAVESVKSHIMEKVQSASADKTADSASGLSSLKEKADKLEAQKARVGEMKDKAESKIQAQKDRVENMKKSAEKMKDPKAMAKDMAKDKVQAEKAKLGEKSAKFVSEKASSEKVQKTAEAARAVKDAAALLK